MKIYELLIGFSTNVEGCIWCTDGSFVEPSMYQSSGKKAYGYALSNNTVVRLTRSLGLAWSPIDSSFYSRMTGAQSSTDGVANSEYLKSVNGFNSDNCPAVYYGCTQTNAGKTSYMPASDELLALYYSIMKGSMRTNLITAGLYESCNYRMKVNSNGWGSIWSSSQDSSWNEYAEYAWNVSYQGRSKSIKRNSYHRVIPFFKVQ